MAKKKIENIFSETEPLWKYVKGTGQWINVIEADDYEKWSVNLYGEEVIELDDELTAYLEEAIAFAKEAGKEVESKADLYKEYDGKKYIQFKRKKYDEDTAPPKLYNITGEEITGMYKKEIGGGSTIRIRAMIKPYFMPSKKVGQVVVPSIVGLSYQLLAVQIIENKEYKGASGFGDESGGNVETPPFEVDGSEY